MKSHHFTTFFRTQDQIQPELGTLSGDLFWEHFERRYGVNPVRGPGVLVGGYDKMGEVDAEGGRAVTDMWKDGQQGTLLLFTLLIST